MLNFIHGGIFVASLAIAAFFMRYWRTTKDKLFYLFAAAFLIFAIERFLLANGTFASEKTPLIYICRLAAFLLIILAVVERNRRK